MKTYNLDANATYGLESGLFELVGQDLQGGLNPSSVHQGGQKSKAILEEARIVLRDILGASRDTRVIFTSGATEANNLAIFSAFSGLIEVRGESHLVVSALEHPSVLEPALEIRRRGLSVNFVYPSAKGKLSLEKILGAITRDTRLVSIMLANNETGEIFPVEEITKQIKSEYPRCLVHCDAVQALGKIEVDFTKLGVDFMSLSAHKIGGFPGVGALVARKGVEISPMLVGGPQELRSRSGTENIPGILSFSKMLKKLKDTVGERYSKMKENAETFWNEVSSVHDLIVRNNFEVDVLPNTLSIRIPQVRADDLVIALDLRGVFISTGAACSSGKQEPSHVLLAKGFSDEASRETVRISFTHEMDVTDVKEAAEIFCSVVSQIKDTKKVANA